MDNISERVDPLKGLFFYCGYIRGRGRRMRTVKVANGVLQRFYEIGDISILKDYLEMNEPFITVNDKFILTEEGGEEVLKVRYRGEDKPLRKVDYKNFRGLNMINDPDQQFFLDDILDPDILLITAEGKAGTGKTFISLLGALSQNNVNVIYTRENIEVGRELGHLPGELGEKFAPYVGGLWDNTREIKRLTGTDYSKRVTVQPINFMRGRSIRDTILIVDEAQNIDKVIAKTLISRAGEGSKVILAGSYRQIDDKGLRNRKTGLQEVIEAFKGQEVFSHNHLVGDKRGILARLADELL